jgi:outer membrane protein OmpA-like peptidoglycan-associated protein
MLVASIAFGVAMTYEAQTADACGVKIATKAPKVRRGGVKSKHRSKILLIGRKDSALKKKLEKAGHSVEQASSVDAAKSSRYGLVIADANQMDAAKGRFRHVLQKKSKSDDTLRSTERILARSATRRKTGPKIVKVRTNRRPTETGREGGSSGRTPVETGREVGGTSVSARTPVDRPTRPSSPTTTGRATATGNNTRVAMNTNKEPANDKPEPRIKPKVDKPKVDKPKVDKPKREPAPKVAKRVRWTREFHFGTNKTRIGPAAQRRLRANAQWLAQNPNATITIEGHTDTVGDEAYNMDLSERRANVARELLIGFGVDDSRINVVPKGEQEPAYEPGTAAKNRRIVLIKNE